MASIHRFVPCLWFDDQAEQAARYYTGIFPNSRIMQVTRYGKEGFEVHQHPAGSVMTVEFELDGQPFTALNGGPLFKFTEAVSLQVMCADQAEIDRYWDQLTVGGDPAAQQCGWLKDRFGLSWQIVPRNMGEFFAGNDPAASERATAALMPMKKLDLAALRRAREGA